MAQIKHIAIATQDADATARFYTEVFGLREIAKLDSANAKGYYLSDGNINLAILDFQNDQVAGPEYGQTYSGIHHIGFEVERPRADCRKAPSRRLHHPGRNQPGPGRRYARHPPRQCRGKIQRPQRRNPRCLRNRLGRHAGAGLGNRPEILIA